MNENDEKIIGAKEGDKIKAESESCRRFLVVADVRSYRSWRLFSACLSSGIPR